jgi:hypothetical protein
MRRPALRALPLALLLAVSGGAAGAAPKPLEGVALEWRPTTTPAVLGFQPLAPERFGVSRLELPALADRREGAADAIGEYRPAGKPALPVTTSTEVPAFVTERLKAELADLGVPFAEAGEPGTIRLRGELLEFFVVEETEYVARVKLAFVLENAGGIELWRGSVGATSGSTGRAYRREIFFETLSDALVQCAVKLLQEPGFQFALAGR